MKTILILFILFTHSKILANVRINTAFNPFANFIYQLDCVSDSLRACSSKNYKALWDLEFLKLKKDQELIKDWRNLKQRYSVSYQINSLEYDRFNIKNTNVNIQNKLRITSLQSKNIEDFLKRLDILLTQQDKAKARLVVSHFYPKFLNWWNNQVQAKGQLFVNKSTQLLNRPDIVNKINQFYNFYEASLNKDIKIPFNFYYRPNLVQNESTSGQQIEKYSVVEFFIDEKPEDRMDVAIHELCHFFYHNSNTNKFKKFSHKFESSKRLSAKPALNLLNESLATALGNGIINKLLNSPEQWNKYLNRKNSFYNDFYIDQTAKAILPEVTTMLSNKQSLYSPDFFQFYLDTIESTFGSRITAPSLILKNFILVGDSSYKKRFSNPLRQMIIPNSMYRSEGSWNHPKFISALEKNKHLNTLALIHPKNINKISEHQLLPNSLYKLINNEYKKNNNAIYSYLRPNNSYLFILIGKDHDSVLRLVEKLIQQKTGFTGFL
ncbi:MAG: hypothetical protein HOO06_03215 [Bdellovibrionaceae bacterium]|jgi:hypothetical protein|nr:hypothetical protein [Pseudobdellovibrionaceae bacterium]